LAPKGIRLVANLTEFIIIGLPFILFKIMIKDFGSESSKLINIEYITTFSLIFGAVCYPIFSGNLGQYDSFKRKIVNFT